MSARENLPDGSQSSKPMRPTERPRTCLRLRALGWFHVIAGGFMVYVGFGEGDDRHIIGGRIITGIALVVIGVGYCAGELSVAAAERVTHDRRPNDNGRG